MNRRGRNHREPLRLHAAVAALLVCFAWTLVAAADREQVDAFDAGLPWYWLVFGFSAQAMFAARFLVQWIASERGKRSVVPTSFWMLSLAGGITLLIYFLRRGDPVGVVGQMFGVFIYARNLILILRGKKNGGDTEAAEQA
jgi:lipid-A-disaccharide synthase-like uncharacterized protein